MLINWKPFLIILRFNIYSQFINIFFVLFFCCCLGLHATLYILYIWKMSYHILCIIWYFFLAVSVVYQKRYPILFLLVLFLEANESRSKHTATKYENMKIWWKESWCFNDYGDGEYFFFLLLLLNALTLDCL